MQTIKLGPIAPITATFPEDITMEGNKFKYEVKASDRDGDVFDVALAEGYVLNLKKDMDIKGFTIDVQTLLEVSLKTRKIKLDGAKTLILDTLVVNELFRGCKVSHAILNFLKEYCSKNDIKYILILAKPIVSYKFGIAKIQSDTYIKNMQNILNNLYLKNGFEWLNKPKKIMYLAIS